MTTESPRPPGQALPPRCTSDGPSVHPQLHRAPQVFAHHRGQAGGALHPGADAQPGRGQVQEGLGTTEGRAGGRGSGGKLGVVIFWTWGVEEVL